MHKLKLVISILFLSLAKQNDAVAQKRQNLIPIQEESMDSANNIVMNNYLISLSHNKKLWYKETYSSKDTLILSKEFASDKEFKKLEGTNLYFKNGKLANKEIYKKKTY